MNDTPMRITSDGTPRGTKVYDVNGCELQGCITKVEWSIEAGGVGVAKITFANVEVDLVGGAEE